MLRFGYTFNYLSFRAQPALLHENLLSINDVDALLHLLELAATEVVNLPSISREGRARGGVSLLCSHQVQDADEVCDIYLAVTVHVGSGIIAALRHQIQDTHSIGNVNSTVTIQVTIEID